MQRLLTELNSNDDWHGIIVVDSQCARLHDAFTFENALRLLPLDQQARILQMKNFPDRCKVLCNRILQIVGCSLASGVCSTQLKFSRGHYGKPQVEAQNVAFGMSNGQRSVGQYLYRLNKPLEVGIDLASTDDYVGDEDLDHFQYVFSAQEMECLQSCDYVHRKAMFAYLWSLKECYTKYTGLGLNSDFSNIDFGKVDLPQPSMHFTRIIESRTMWFYSKWINETEIITVCHEEAGKSCTVPAIYRLTFLDLLTLSQARTGGFES